MSHSLKLLVVSLAFGLTTAEASARDRMTLIAVGADTDAKGFAARSVAPRHRLQIKLEKLAGSSTFTLVADGVQIDTFTSTRGGTFERIYEKDPSGSQVPLPAAIDPVTNIKVIEIRSSSGEVIVSGAFGAPVQTVIKQFELNPTVVDPDARGEVEIRIAKENGTVTEQRLRCDVENLSASSSFKLFVDGNNIASFATDSGGAASIIFSSNPSPGELPLPPSLGSLEDVQLVEVRTLDGQTVLTSGSGAPAGKTATLTSTGTIPNATGQATLTAADLKFSVAGLTPLSVFLVRVDGRLAGAIDTDSAGSGELELASAPSGCMLPLPTSINLSTALLVEISNEAGTVVLSGMFR